MVNPILTLQMQQLFFFLNVFFVLHFLPLATHFWQVKEKARSDSLPHGAVELSHYYLLVKDYFSFHKCAIYCLFDTVLA